MKLVFSICSAAILLSCTVASSQIINHTTQIKTSAQINISAKSEIVLIAGKKRRGGLSGQAGNVRKRGPRGRSGCAAGFKKYVAARGHSAYAQTPSSGYFSGAICGWSLNASSAKGAEKAALRGCSNGLKKYKTGVRGKCSVFASK